MKGTVLSFLSGFDSRSRHWFSSLSKRMLARATGDPPPLTQWLLGYVGSHVTPAEHGNGSVSVSSSSGRLLLAQDAGFGEGEMLSSRLPHAWLMHMGGLMYDSITLHTHCCPPASSIA